MRTSTVIRIIVILLIILVASVALTAVLQKREKNSTADTGTPSVTDTAGKTAEPSDTGKQDPANTGKDTAGNTEKQPGETDKPAETQQGQVDPPTPPDTSKKDDPAPLDPPKAPDSFSKSGKFTTDISTKLIGIMSYQAYAENGKVKLTVTYSLQYYPALLVGARKNCYIRMNDSETAFTMDRIEDEGDLVDGKIRKPKRTMELFTATAFFNYGETVTLEANYPIGLDDYSGEEIRALHAVGSVTLK